MSLVVILGITLVSIVSVAVARSAWQHDWSKRNAFLLAVAPPVLFAVLMLAIL